MFESLFTFELARQRHRSAPLLPEREQFLKSLRVRGASNNVLLQSASSLVYIMKYLSLDKLRPIDFEEIKRAGRVWVKARNSNLVRDVNVRSIYGFTGLARRFLQFHRSFVEQSMVSQPFEQKLSGFISFMKMERGLSPDTVKGNRWHLIQFLNWVSLRGERFSSLSLNQIDHYLIVQSKKWSPGTVKTAAQTLRSFFYFARTKGWCPRMVPEAIKGPFVVKEYPGPVGPKWVDVRRLLLSEKLDTPASMRAQVFLILFALYGLRTSEATGLIANNFDWKTKTFTVKRAKNYTLQRFPMFRQFELAVLRYLKLGRPDCDNKFLLVTLKPPYRRLQTGAVSQIVKSRIERLGIDSHRKGPHSLRHACATRLLNKEMSLQQIADFLGHNDCLSVGIYAKHDLKTLRKVVAPDLCRGL